MDELVLHPSTKTAVNSFLNSPSHAVMITGPSGIGKGGIAQFIAARILGKVLQELENYPYLKIVQPEDQRVIKIEAVRELQHFLSLKVPGASGIARIIIIEDAHMLGEEAQNALLKTLEEPPVDTLLILTAAHQQSLLPTIRSRVQMIAVNRPGAAEISSYFKAMGYNPTDIQKAQLMSAGLPGLMDALLQGDVEHPLVKATATARELLQKNTFERLAMVDVLSKQKQATLDILFILQQMADVSLQKSGDSEAAVKRWKVILEGAYDATEQLQKNAQAKLVLTNLMLNM